MTRRGSNTFVPPLYLTYSTKSAADVVLMRPSLAGILTTIAISEIDEQDQLQLLLELRL
jgi:uncharacterized protein with ACT and thioredoxin-like domain